MAANIPYKLFLISIYMLFLAWIAKMQFIFGGDYLFRIGTIGVVIALFWMLIIFRKDDALKSSGLSRIFSINLIVLAILYLGMVLKVSHLLDSQIEKDLLLDFVGIPSMLICLTHTFANIQNLLESPIGVRVLFYKHIVLAWVGFILSMVLYALYSAILLSQSPA